MPALTRFTLTDLTKKNGKWVRLKLAKSSGDIVEAEATLILESDPPRYVWNGSVNNVTQIEYALDWTHPVLGDRTHAAAVSDPGGRKLFGTAVDVTTYFLETDIEPDWFEGLAEVDAWDSRSGLPTAAGVFPARLLYVAPPKSTVRGEQAAKADTRKRARRASSRRRKA